MIAATADIMQQIAVLMMGIGILVSASAIILGIWIWTVSQDQPERRKRAARSALGGIIGGVIIGAAAATAVYAGALDEFPPRIEFRTLAIMAAATLITMRIDRRFRRKKPSGEIPDDPPAEPPGG